MLRWFPDWNAVGVRLWCQTDNLDIPVGGTKILWMPWCIFKDKDPACHILGSQYSFQTSLYCDGFLPHTSTNDWQPFLSLMCQPYTQCLFHLFKKGCHNNFQNKFSHSQKHWYCLHFSWWNEQYGALVEWKCNMIPTITYVTKFSISGIIQF